MMLPRNSIRNLFVILFRTVHKFVIFGRNKNNIVRVLSASRLSNLTSS